MSQVTSYINPNQTPVSSGVTTPDNGWTSNNLYASFATINDFAYYGVNAGWNWGIPANATIFGIEIEIEGKYTGAGVNHDIGISLSWDGGGSFTSEKTWTPTGTSDALYLIGGATDTWGRTWTVAQLEDNQNLYIQPKCNSISVTSIDLDAIRMRVYYDIIVSPFPSHIQV
jgi:hypothetical protein